MRRRTCHKADFTGNPITCTRTTVKMRARVRTFQINETMFQYLQETWEFSSAKLSNEHKAAGRPHVRWLQHSLGREGCPDL